MYIFNVQKALDQRDTRDRKECITHAGNTTILQGNIMNSHTEDKKVESAHHVDDKINAPKEEKDVINKSHDNAEEAKKVQNSDVEKHERDAYSQSRKK
jgi:hypothetical protein